MTKEPNLQSMSLLLQGRDWKVLLWDTEEEVHGKVYSALRSFSYHGKGIELISATNLDIAKILVEQHSELAVLIIGKTDENPLDLIRYLRNEVMYLWPQILCCTGVENCEDMKSEILAIRPRGEILVGASARSLLYEALENFEEKLGYLNKNNKLPMAPEAFGKGQVTIVRWQDKVNWQAEFVSLNFNGLLGYSGEDVVSEKMTFSSLIFPADLERITLENQENLERKLANFTHQYRLVHRTGRVVWVYDYTTAIYDDSGRIIQCISYLNDITSKKEQERLLFDKEIFGVLALDEQDRIYEINQTAGDILRTHPEKAIGRLLLDWVAPSMRQSVESYIRQTKKTKKPQKFETNLVTYGDQRLPCHFTLAPQQEGAGLEGVLIIIEDLTEKKKIEDDLKRALAAEKAFIASVSHEIRTPLASILGYTELMRSSSGLTDEQRQFVENIDINSNHLLNLINDILDISKLESNQLTLNPQEVVFSDVFAACGVVVSSKVKEGVKLNVNIPDFDYYIKCDPVRIKQIFINLLSNAAKFTEKGAIYLYLKDMTPLENDLISMRICVEDTGIGISSEKQTSLFQPFKQAHIGDFGGTGLGLYLSRSIAKLMDGDITVSSELGKGSKFIVELVLSKGRLKESEFNFQEKEILILGDYPSLNDHHKSKLLETGAKLKFVDGTDRGRDLVQKLLELKRIDLALIDMDILKNKAAYLAGLIKDLMPQVAILGIKTKNLGIESQEFDDFLLKPFSFFQLGNAIKKQLQHEKGESQLDFGSLKILMAEDAAANRMLYQQMFKKFFSISLELAENGIQACEMAEKKAYDLILMDLQMPKMDGFTASREIRKKDKNVNIVALTGSVYSEILKKCSSAGMNGYLAKPVQKDELIEILKKVLQRELISLDAPPEPSNRAKAIKQAFAAPKPQNHTPITNHIRNFLQSMGSPQEVVNEILNSACTEIAECYRGIMTSSAALEMEVMQKHLHKLKGLLMNFDLGRQSELVKDIELLVKDVGDETLIKKRMELFLEEFKEFGLSSTKNATPPSQS